MIGIGIVGIGFTGMNPIPTIPMPTIFINPLPEASWRFPWIP
jgi:hypothetical protein